MQSHVPINYISAMAHGSAARQQSERCTNPLDQARAGHAQGLGRSRVLLAALGLVGSVVLAIVFVARRFGLPALVDGFAEHVVLDAELTRHFAARVALIE